jgi:hypothetical protein
MNLGPEHPMVRLAEATYALTLGVGGLMADRTSGGRFDPAGSEAEYVEAGRQLGAALGGIPLGELSEYEIAVVRLDAEKKRQRAADHEFGHIVLAVIGDLGYGGTTLDPDFPADGATTVGRAVERITNGRPSSEEERLELLPLARRVAAYLVAGLCSEIAFNRAWSPSSAAAHDLREARRVCEVWGTPGSAEDLLRKAFNAATALIVAEQTWAVVTDSQLMGRGRVGGATGTGIFEGPGGVKGRQLRDLLANALGD